MRSSFLQHALLELEHAQLKVAVEEAKCNLQEAKDRREKIVRDTDRMKEEIAAW